LKFLLVLLLLIVLFAGGAAAWMWYGITKPYQGFAAEGVFIDVPRGASSRHVASVLKTNGVVRSALAFEILCEAASEAYAAGWRILFRSCYDGPRGLLEACERPGVPAAIHVREGETMFDIARELEAAKFMRAGDFLFAAGDPVLIRDFAPGAQTLEGFLFPATYELPRHPAASELTAEMVHKFKEEWKQIASPPGEDQQTRVTTGP